MAQQPDTYDVAIVGARIGGAVLAAFLGDAGHQVLLIDRASFPSDAISTHFFRGSGLAGILGELGLLDEIDATGAPRLSSEYLYTDGRAEPTVTDPQAPGSLGYNLSVRRLALDALLVQRATRSASVRLRERSVVTDLVRDDGRVVGVRIGDEVVRATWVVGADGQGSLIARLVDAPIQERHDPIRALFYVYVTGFEARATGAGATPDGPEFSFRGDELAYVFPSDAGVTCVAVSVNRDAFHELRAGGLEAFGACIDRHRGLADRYRSATLVSRLLGQGPQPSTVRVPAGHGWALVGDSGMRQDPWTGEGMDSAARSARALAEELDAQLRGRRAPDAVIDRYHAARDAQGLDNFHDTVAGGRDLRALG